MSVKKPSSKPISEWTDEEVVQYEKDLERAEREANIEAKEKAIEQAEEDKKTAKKSILSV